MGIVGAIAVNVGGAFEFVGVVAVVVDVVAVVAVVVDVADVGGGVVDVNVEGGAEHSLVSRLVYPP